jgi:hypothetical protein
MNSSGSNNIAIGDHALSNNETGHDNVVVGTATGGTGSFNTVVGIGSLAFNNAARRNTAVGYGSLGLQSFGLSGSNFNSDNTAVGFEALYSNQPTSSLTGIQNTAVGALSLRANTVGYQNTAVGAESLASNTTGRFATAVGYRALFTQSFDNGGVDWHTGNTAVGYEALYSNQPTTPDEGYNNTAIGIWALRSNTTGRLNVAVGAGALFSNTTARSNVAIGTGSLYANQTGSWNTAVGNTALQKNFSGDRNTAAGQMALFNNDTGADNVALGDHASVSNTGGSWNVSIGKDALFDNQTGNGNIAIGHTAGQTETGSNRLYIANAMASALIYGQFDTQRVAIAATDPTVALDVNGQIRMRVIVASPLNYVCYDGNGVFGYCSSDASLKEDVRPLTADHDVTRELASLRGVTFAWKDKERGGEKRDMGLLAQEVEPVLPEVVSTNLDGYKSVDYPKLTAFLIEVAKAQQKEIVELKARLDALERAAPRP